jgi:hypothetical protein
MGSPSVTHTQTATQLLDGFPVKKGASRRGNPKTALSAPFAQRLLEERRGFANPVGIVGFHFSTQSTYFIEAI